MSAPRTLSRSLGLATQILGTRIHADRPFKVTWMLTDRCDCRCEACFIWAQPKSAESDAERIASVLRTVPSLRWVNLTGGEPFLRDDIPEIAAAVHAALPKLAVLDFPTTGQRTDAILAGCREIATLGIPRVFVSISIEGPSELHDTLRGRPGAFENAMRTYAGLRAMPGIRPYLGMTLSSRNAHAVGETLAAVRARGLAVGYRDLHLNVYTESGHYYANVGGAPQAPEGLEETLRQALRAREGSWDPADVIESVYLRQLPVHLRTGRSPVPCKSLRAGFFVNVQGDLFPCTVWDRRLGNVFETPLPTLLASHAADEARRIIAKDACPGCWSPCEAHPSIVAGAPATLLRR